LPKLEFRTFIQEAYNRTSSSAVFLLDQEQEGGKQQYANLQSLVLPETVNPVYVLRHSQSLCFVLCLRDIKYGSYLAAPRRCALPYAAQTLGSPVPKLLEARLFVVAFRYFCVIAETLLLSALSSKESKIVYL
jgi:hypothetical protein